MSTVTTAAAPLANFRNPFANKKIVEVKVTKVKFLSDHQAMTDNNSDWKNTGSTFSKPEWTYGNASSPISHTKNRELSLELDFEVWPKDADEVDACVINGDGAFAGLNFTATMKLKGGTYTGVYFKSPGKFADAVKMLSGDIQWSADVPGQGRFAAGSSWGHKVYVTIDTPISAPNAEAGITQKRMDKAVSLISPFSTNDPHTIVQKMMGLLPGYWLNSTPPSSYSGPPIPADLNYPRYLGSAAAALGGAWNIADFTGALAECQAIVRFVRAVIKQVGCPGEAKVMVVFADPDFNNGSDTKEQDYELPINSQADATINGMAGYGLNNHTPKVINGLPCFPSLLAPETAANAKEGYTFDMNTVDDKWIGLNNFEACLKFTAPNAAGASISKYYGGGAGITDTKEQMISAFDSLAWVSPIASPPGKRMMKIVKIIKKF